MSQRKHFSAQLRLQQAMTIFTGWGMPENIALETDLLGIDSHGISMPSHYDKLLQEGKWRPDTQVVAGEPENQRYRQRQRDGIPVSAPFLTQLHALCVREHFVDLLSPVTRA